MLNMHFTLLMLYSYWVSDFFRKHSTLSDLAFFYEGIFYFLIHHFFLDIIML